MCLSKISEFNSNQRFNGLQLNSTSSAASFRGNKFEGDSFEKKDDSGKKIILGTLLLACLGFAFRKSIYKIFGRVSENIERHSAEPGKIAGKERPLPNRLVRKAKETNGDFFVAKEFELCGKKLKLKKQVKLERTVLENGQTVEHITLQYSVADAKGNILGTWSGAVKYDQDGMLYIEGHLVDTEQAGKIKGLGDKLKQFVDEEGKQIGCKYISIKALWNSHVFHYKNGYKVFVIDMEPYKAVDLLTKIKESGQLTELHSRIENAIKSNDLTEMAEVLNEALELAAKKRLRSENIGLKDTSIPMRKYL